MDLKKHNRHKETIGDVSPFARKVIFWSSVSLFCVYGDIYVETTEMAETVNSTVTFFGIRFFGITQDKFWYFLIALNIYHAVKFSFFVLKINIIANSWTVFKDVIFTKEFDKGVSEAEIDSIEKELESDHISGKTSIDGGKLELTDPKKDAEDQRELLLVMKRYNVMGFLEYFFSPIIFPTILSLWALVTLLIQAFC